MSGVPVEGRCAGCGEPIASGDRFCQNCGRSLLATAADGGGGQNPPPFHHRSRGPFVALATVGILAVAAAVVLTVLLTRSPGSVPSNAQLPATNSGTGTSPLGSTPPTSEGSATGPFSGNVPPSGPRSWDGVAVAQAPSTSPDGLDGTGHRTTYVAANMLDGDPATAWRMNGDGTGILVTFTLDQPRPITALALVNGYAKIDPATGVDRYAQERRILVVSWLVGGRVYEQDLVDGVQGLQGIRIPGTQAGTVTLRIDAVSEPGDPNFDYTSISDVLIGDQ